MVGNRLKVYIQPRASKTGLAGTHDGAVKIRIASPPVDNAANRALIEFVARTLGIARSRVRIVAGVASRTKTLEIDDVSEADLGAAFPAQAARKSSLR